MKTLQRLFIVAMLTMVCNAASAQSASGWNEFTFDLGYGNSYDTEDDDYNEDIWGFSFNYGRGIHLSSNNGLTLRPGAGILVGYQHVDGDRYYDSYYDSYYGYYDDYDKNTVCVSITSKLDFGYHVIFPGSSVSLFPYVGLTTRFNVWGQIDYDDETYDLFASDEGDANRVQVGGRIGFDAHFSRFVLGMTYEHDFSEFAENIKLWNVNLRLGWCF